MPIDENESIYENISIPATLIKKLKKHMEKTKFESISSYVNFILRKYISNIEADEQKKTAFSKEEEEKVKHRLRSLGYID